MFWDWISYKWYIHIFYHWVIKLGAFKSFKLMEMICNSCFQGNAPSTSSNSPVLHRDFIYSSWWINDSEHPKPHTQMGNQRGYSKWWYIEKYLFIQKNISYPEIYLQYTKHLFTISTGTRGVQSLNNSLCHVRLRDFMVNLILCKRTSVPKRMWNHPFCPKNEQIIVYKIFSKLIFDKARRATSW